MCWWRAASSFEKSHCISNWPSTSWTLALSFAWECFRHSRNPNSHLPGACHNSYQKSDLHMSYSRDHDYLRLSQSTRSPGSAGSLLDHSSWGKAMAQYVFALLAISFLRCIAFEFDATLKLGWWRGAVFWNVFLQASPYDIQVFWVLCTSLYLILLVDFLQSKKNELRISPSSQNTGKELLAARAHESSAWCRSSFQSRAVFRTFDVRRFFILIQCSPWVMTGW